MEVNQIQFITVCPNDKHNGWNLEVRSFPEISDSGTVMSIITDQVIPVSSKEKAEELGQTLAEKHELTFVPEGNNVTVICKVGKNHTAYELTPSKDVIETPLDELVEKVERVKHPLWAQVERHSKEYCKRLELSKKDLKYVEDYLQGYRGIYPSLSNHAREAFLKFEIDKKIFSLYVHHTCACDYGASWVKTVQVVCESDSALNQSLGGGTTLINAIPEEWHEKFLEKLNDGVKTSLREKINFHVARKQRIWNQVENHSNTYMSLFGLSKVNIEIVQSFIQGHAGIYPSLGDYSRNGFLGIEVDGKLFSFYTCHTCARPYESDWMDTIQVACDNDDTLNESVGRGTTLINTIPEEWHEKLLKQIDKSIINRLHEQVGAIIKRNKRIWGQVEKFSQNYLERLRMKNKEFKVLEYHFDDKEVLTFEIEHKVFTLIAKQSCAIEYGAPSQKTIQVFCVSDPDLNESIGRGTTFINTVPEEWHEKILNLLDEEKVASIHEAIDSVTDHKERL